MHVWETGTVPHHARHSLDSVEAFEIFIHGVAAAVVVIASVHFSGLILQPSLLLRNLWARDQGFILQKNCSSEMVSLFLSMINESDAFL